MRLLYSQVSFLIQKPRIAACRDTQNGRGIVIEAIIKTISSITRGRTAERMEIRFAAGVTDAAAVAAILLDSKNNNKEEEGSLPVSVGGAAR